MKPRLLSPAGIAGAFLLATVFILWSLWLILSVAHLQEVVSHHVGLVSRLHGVEQTVRELRATDDEKGAQADPVAEARLRNLYGRSRQQLADLRAGAGGAANLPGSLDRVQHDIDQAQADEPLRRRHLHSALDELAGAVRGLRERLSAVSTDLAGKWRQLNALVIVSCALAMTLALVCASYRRAVLRRQQAEQALRASEERFRAFMDHSPAVAWMKDDGGRYIYLNKSIEKQFGMRRAVLHGRTDEEVWPPDVARRFRETDASVLATRAPIETVESVLHPDGTPHDWWVFKFPFLDKDGRMYVGGVAVDITERQQVEEAQKALIAQLRQALEEVKTLRGLIPVCAWCKKVRNDAGYWQQLESYVRDHTLARVTHSACPECLEKALQDLR